MHKVYRYEKNGVGPYQYYCKNEYMPELDEMVHVHTCSREHPVIGTDTKEYSLMGNLCACPSLKSLKEWFRGYNGYLIKYNFSIWEYTVYKFNDTYSGKQLEFHPNDVISKRKL